MIFGRLGIYAHFDSGYVQLTMGVLGRNCISGQGRSVVTQTIDVLCYACFGSCKWCFPSSSIPVRFSRAERVFLFVFFGSQEQQTIATASLNKSEIPFFFFLHFSFESLYLVLTRNSVIYYVFLAANFSSSCFFFYYMLLSS